MARIREAASPREQLRAIEQAINSALIVPKFTVATLPSPTAFENRIVRVTDEVGGDTLAWADGTDWRRTTDNAIVS